VFIILVVVRIDKEHNEREVRTQFLRPVPATASLPLPDLPAAPTINATPKYSKDRIFLSQNMTADLLTELCENKTSVHADKAIQPYIGKWFRYTGPVKNVYASAGSVEIRFKTETFNNITFQIQEDTDISDILHIGDVITIIGKIKWITSASINLTNSEVEAR
jgi:hypothetical protein